MPKPAKADKDLALTVGKYLRTLERGKKAYKLSDALMDKLEKELKPGQVVLLLTGKKVRFVDKFAERNLVNMGMNARRYEFKEVVEP